MLYLWAGWPTHHLVAALAIAAAGAVLGWLLAIFITKHLLLTEIRRVMFSMAGRLGLAPQAR
jgi:hypothetical protein